MLTVESIAVCASFPIFCESVRMYVIRPDSYSFCAVRIVREGEKPKPIFLANDGDLVCVDLH